MPCNYIKCSKIQTGINFSAPWLRKWWIMNRESIRESVQKCWCLKGSEIWLHIGFAPQLMHWNRGGAEVQSKTACTWWPSNPLHKLLGNVCPSIHADNHLSTTYPNNYKWLGVMANTFCTSLPTGKHRGDHIYETAKVIWTWWRKSLEETYANAREEHLWVKQSGRLCNKHLHWGFEELGYWQSKIDPCL